MAEITGCARVTGTVAGAPPGPAPDGPTPPVFTERRNPL
jgi:hypothetical protein